MVRWAVCWFGCVPAHFLFTSGFTNTLEYFVAVFCLKQTATVFTNSHFSTQSDDQTQPTHILHQFISIRGWLEPLRITASNTGGSRSVQHQQFPQRFPLLPCCSRCSSQLHRRFQRLTTVVFTVYSHLTIFFCKGQTNESKKVHPVVSLVESYHHIGAFLQHLLVS